MIGRLAARAALALALALPLAACDGDSGLDADTGRVTLLLTDAAAEIEAAVVTISQVYLQGGEGEDGEGGRVVLMDTEMTTDLLTLSNDVKVMAEDVVVPAGSYSQLRFVITGGYIEVANGDGTTTIYATDGYEPLPEGREADDVLELQCPSCATSGLKVDLPPGTTVEGDENIVLADFDVEQSFGHAAGQSGKWVMHPVIKVSDLGQTGSVRVRLELADSVNLPEINGTQVTLGDFTATLTPSEGGEEQLALTDEDDNDVFEAEFKYLMPGHYTVAIGTDAAVSFTLDLSEHPVPVTVGAGERVDVAAVVTSAAAN